MFARNLIRYWVTTSFDSVFVGLLVSCGFHKVRMYQLNDIHCSFQRIYFWLHSQSGLCKYFCLSMPGCNQAFCNAGEIMQLKTEVRVNEIKVADLFYPICFIPEGTTILRNKEY